MSRILFAAPSFFGYEKDIYDAIIRKGHEVVFVSLTDRMSNPDNQILKILDSFKPELFFCIKGENLSVSICRKIHTSKIQSVLYLYDSINIYRHSLELSEYFDKVLSFDKRDCSNYGFEFMPLFFTDCFDGKRDIKTMFKYDIMSVSSYYPNEASYFQKN